MSKTSQKAQATPSAVAKRSRWHRVRSIASSVWVLLCIALFNSAAFAIDVSGTINDANWAPAGSPYIVTSDLIVNGTLQVRPSVVVLVRPGVKITIRGRLDAKDCVFTSSNDTTGNALAAAGDWAGLELVDTRFTSTLTSVSIRYGNGLTLKNSTAEIYNSSFVSNAGAAIRHDLDSKLSGEGLSATGNGLDAIELESRNTPSLSLFAKGIPYVVRSRLSIGPDAIGFEPADTSIVQGGTRAFKVKLYDPAPAGGLTLALQVNAGLSVPASVSIPGGESEAVFDAQANTIGQYTLSTSAVGIGTARASVSVISQPRLVITEQINTFVGSSHSTQFRIEPPSPNPLTINVSSNNTGVATVASPVLVPPYATYGNFVVKGVGAGSADVTLSTAGYQSASGVAEIRFRSMSIPSALNMPRGIGRVTVNFDGTVPAGGITLNLTSSNPSVLTIPATQNVPAEARSADILVNGLALGSSNLTVQHASYGSTSGTVTIEAVNLLFGNSPIDIPQGLEEEFELKLSGRGPVGGTPVVLSASSPDVVITPRNLLFVGGQQGETLRFRVKSNTQGSYTLSASGAPFEDGSHTFIVGPKAVLDVAQPVIVAKHFQTQPKVGLRYRGQIYSANRPRDYSIVSNNTAVVGVSNLSIIGVAISNTETIRIELPGVDPTTAAVDVRRAQLTISELDGLRTLSSQKDAFRITLGLPGIVQSPAAPIDIPVAVVQATPTDIVELLGGDNSAISSIRYTGAQGSGQALVSIPGDVGSYKISAQHEGVTEISEVQTVKNLRLRFNRPDYVVGTGMRATGLTVELLDGDAPYQTPTQMVAQISNSLESKLRTPSGVVFQAGQSSAQVPLEGIQASSSPIAIRAFNQGTVPFSPSNALSIYVNDPELQFLDLTQQQSLASGRKAFRVKASVPGSSEPDQKFWRTTDFVPELENVTPAGNVSGVVNSNGAPLAVIPIAAAQNTSGIAYVNAPTAAGSYQVRVSQNSNSNSPWISAVQTILLTDPNGTGLRTLTFDGARDAYQFSGEAGETVRLTINAPNNCDVYAIVTSLDGSTYVGYATVLASNPITLPSTGTFAVSVGANGCIPITYELYGKNGTNPLTITNFTGVVNGRLLEADGLTPLASAKVRLQSTPEGNAVAFHSEATTNAAGEFSFNNVIQNPSAEQSHRLSSLPIAANASYAQAKVTLLSPPSIVTQDLRLAPLTTLDIRLLKGDGSPFDTQASIRVTSPDWLAANVTIYDGQALIPFISDQTIKIEATNSNTGLRSLAFVEPADTTTQLVQMTLEGVSISGKVKLPDGTPVVGANVQARADGNSLRWVYSNAQGDYLLENLAINETIELIGIGPTNEGITSETLTPTSAAPLVRDIVLLGTGSVQGKLKTLGGQGIGGKNIYANYDLGWASAYTDENGDFSLSGLPLNRSITLTSENVLGFTATAEVTLTSAGQVLTQDLTLPINTGSVRVRFTGADGLPVQGDGEVSIYYENEGSDYKYLPFDEDIVFSVVPPGTHRLYIYFQGFTVEKSITVVANEETLQDYLFSVIKGTLTYADGSPADGEVYATDSEGFSRYDYATDGDYVIYNAAPGDVSLSASTNSGLNATATATLVAGTPLTVDLQLPPIGSVSGQVRDASGAGVSAMVYLQSALLGWTRFAFTDDSGNFYYDEVPAGDVQLRAQSGNLFADGSGALSADQTLTVNLNLPQAAQLSGVVTNTNGTPRASACVTALSVEQAFVAVDPVFTRANSAGTFSFNSLQPGLHSIVASDCGSQIGLTSARLNVGSNVTDVQLGGAAERLLLTDSGFQWRMTGILGGWLDVFGPWGTVDSFRIAVDSREFNSTLLAGRIMSANREIAFGPVMLSGLELSRRFYTPTASGYTRTLEILENPSAAPITVQLQMRARLNGLSTLVIAPSANDQRYAILANPSNDSGAAAVIMAGTGATPPSTSDFNTSTGATSWTQSVTVPANSKVALVHYIAQRTTGALSELQTQAAELAAGTHPGMFDGISNAERAVIRNFVVSPQ